MNSKGRVKSTNKNAEPFTRAEWSESLSEIIARTPLRRGVRKTGESQDLGKDVSVGETARELIRDLRMQFKKNALFKKKYAGLYTLLTSGKEEHVVVLLGLSARHGGVHIHPHDTIYIDEHGRLIYRENLRGREHVLINEHLELRPLSLRG